MDRIPEELKHEILLLISNDESGIRNQTLFNVMLSSKRLYHIARPILYNTVELGDEFAKFMQALAYKPDTINMVRQLHVGPFRDMRDGSFRHKESFLDFLLLKAGIADMPGHYQRSIRYGLSDTSKDVLPCILLSMCQNLLVLEIRGAFWMWDFFTKKFAPEVKCRKNLLDNLRLLKTQAPSPSDKYSVWHVMPFWESPSLECYEGHRFECMNIIPGPPPQPSNLRHIVLRDTLISPTGLEYILTTCPLLRTLDIELASSLTVGYRPDWRSCGEVLSRRGAGLERLVLDAHLFGHEPMDTSLGDLTGMRELRSLYLEWNAGFGPPGSALAEANLGRDAFLAVNLPSRRLRELVLRTDGGGGGGTCAAREDAQLVGLMGSGRFGSLDVIVVLNRDALLSALPQGWRQSLGGEGRRLEWGSGVAGCWLGRVVETEGALILERV